jgi:hypothetical protein
MSHHIALSHPTDWYGYQCIGRPQKERNKNKEGNKERKK